jgi:catechol-2,3-dioxygenase
MAVSGIDHVNLRSDPDVMEALREFYCTVVGLTVGPRPAFGTNGYWLYAGERAILHLSQSRPGETRAAGAVGTLDHIAFACVDRATTEERLRSLGIAYRTGRIANDAPMQIVLKDPAGNGVELNFASD